MRRLIRTMSRDNPLIVDPERKHTDGRRLERSLGRSVSLQGWSRALYGPKHLVVLMFGRHPAATNSIRKHSMFSQSSSSSGLRLVPATNSQKLSASRLNYKPFGGAKPARSKGGLANVGFVACDSFRTCMGRVRGHRLGRPEELLATGASRLPKA